MHEHTWAEPPIGAFDAGERDSSDQNVIPAINKARDLHVVCRARFGAGPMKEAAVDKKRSHLSCRDKDPLGNDPLLRRLFGLQALAARALQRRAEYGSLDEGVGSVAGNSTGQRDQTSLG